MRLPNRAARKRTINIVFLMPALIWFLIVVVIPFFSGIPYSFTNWNGVTKDYDFVGLKNYVTLFGATDFWNAIWNTFTYTFFYVILANIAGLMIALLIHRSSKFNNVCRTIVFMPYVVSMLAAAFVWRSIFNDIYSPMFGVPSPLGQTDQAMTGIIIIAIWRTAGYTMLIYIAALQGVPAEYYEAATVEGAGFFQKFRKITVPMIMPAFAVNVSLLMAWGLKVFDTIMGTTGGGPGKATETMSIYVYRNIFSYLKAGFGQAAAVVMTVILLVLTSTVSRFFRKQEVEL